MRCARLLATVVVVVIVVGCSYIGANAPASSEVPSPAPSVATSASPSSAPSETALTVASPIGPSADPTPTTSHTTPAVTHEPTLQPTPCCESSPLPSPSHAAGLAASNRFWERWYETCWFGAFPIASSLAEITGQSDLVIRGTITDLYVRFESDWQPAYAKVLISDVLKGEPVSREAGTVEVQIAFASSDLEELRSSLPRHDHLWFLVHEGTRDPDSQSAIAGFTYYTTDYAQVSVLRDVGGVVEVIMPEAIANAYSRRHFPVPLDGTSFEELVDQVRQLAEGPSAAVHAYARWSPSGEPDPNRFDAC